MNEEYNFGVDKDGNFYRVEYVPVVRCKDCKHFTQFFVIGMCYCSLLQIAVIDGEWYCADGVKRDD